MNNAWIPFLGIVVAAVLAVVTAAASSVASKRANATRLAHVNATRSAHVNATRSAHVNATRSAHVRSPQFEGRVLDLGPPPNLDPPTEVLKLIGSPQVEETDKESYKVSLPFSRELTAGEQDAAAALAGPAESPAGLVRVDHDANHLVVTDTTIEKVAQHRDSLVEIVSKIAAEGEEYRKRAVDAQRKADEDHDARQAERARRRDAAKEIKFD